MSRPCGDFQYFAFLHARRLREILGICGCALETRRWQEQKRVAREGQAGRKFVLPLFPERRGKRERRRRSETGWREQA